MVDAIKMVHGKFWSPDGRRPSQTPVGVGSSREARRAARIESASAHYSVDEVGGGMKLTEVGEGEPLVEDEVVQGGLLLLLAASAAYAAGPGGGCEATGTDSGSSSKACSTRGAATCLPNRWLADSKMTSA